MIDAKEITAEFNKGQIIQFRAIYDVTFKPIFKLSNRLGFVADSMKQYYKLIRMGPDQSKNSLESVIAEKDHITAYISMNGFRVVYEGIGTRFDFSEMRKHLKYLDVLVSNALTSFKKQKQEIPDITRIGVRFIHIRKIEGEGIKSQDFYKQLVNPNWVGLWETPNDRLHHFFLKLAPQDAFNKGDREVQINIQPVNLKVELDEEVITLNPSAWIDTIVGHFGLGKNNPDLDLLEGDYAFVEKYVLEKFRR